jgi:hypothetical protein
MNADGTIPGFSVPATGPVQAMQPEAERWTDLRLYSTELHELGFIAGVMEAPGGRYLAVFDHQVQLVPDFPTYEEAAERVRQLADRALRLREARQATIRG